MRKHKEDGRIGERLRDGIRVAIVGEPNVGKSSLLNRICRRPAAIVTPIAGTTRDPLDVALNLGGYPIVLTDTAGLRETEDMVEKEGVRRAKEKLREADILLVVLDASDVSSTNETIQQRIDDVIAHAMDIRRRHPRSELNNDVSADMNEWEAEVARRDIDDEDEDESRSSPETLVVLNKVDLVQRAAACENDGRSSTTRTIRTSCANGDGLDELLDTLCDVVKKLCTLSETAETIPLTQERHRFLVRRAIKSLENFLDTLDRGERELVIAAECLRDAMYALGKITGEDMTTDEMLDVLFRDFCIGK